MRKQYRCAAKSALAVILLAAWLLTGCSGMLPMWNNQNEQLEALLEQEFVKAMESDYITMRVYLQNPENYGVERSRVPVNLGKGCQPKERRSEQAELAVLEESLEVFDKKRLTGESRDSYEIVQRMISLRKELLDERFDYYETIFKTSGGLHFQLVTLFADWEMYSLQDAEDTVVLLQDVKPYIADALEYTREQARRGTLMTNTAEVAEYCRMIVAEEDTICTNLQEKVRALGLEKEIEQRLCQDIVQAYEESFVPAYEEIAQVMDEIGTSGVHDRGLGALEHGEEYYRLLLREAIGSDASIDEMEELIEFTVFDIVDNILEIEEDFDENFDDMIEDIPENEQKFTDYTQIMEYLRKRMGEAFVSAGNLSYEIKEIPEALAADNGIAAYFKIPPLDHSGKKQLRVNPYLADLQSISTFSSVAHEGFPGHMYQRAVLYNAPISNFRKTIADEIAFSEGYATYAETRALFFLEHIPQQLLMLYQLSNQLSNLMLLHADMVLHLEGLSADELKERVEVLAGIEDDDANLYQEIYTQLWSNPAIFMPYHYGFLEFEQLRLTVEELLGDHFDEKAYHESLLEIGSVPFPVLRRHVLERAYEQKKSQKAKGNTQKQRSKQIEQELDSSRAEQPEAV